LPVSVLAQFERAAALRDAMFQGDAGKLSVPFVVEPIKVDQRIDTVSLDVDGQQLIYRNGPVRPITMRWPGPQDASGATLSFGPDRTNGPSAAAFAGPVGFLRLLMAGTLVPDNAPDYFLLSFNLGDRAVSFRLHAASIHNLFGELSDLHAFRCPSW